MKILKAWKMRTMFAFASANSEKIHRFIDEPTDRKISEEHQVELLIDSSIANYAEPSAGLEQRVLNFLAAERTQVEQPAQKASNI